VCNREHIIIKWRPLSDTSHKTHHVLSYNIYGLSLFNSQSSRVLFISDTVGASAHCKMNFSLSPTYSFSRSSRVLSVYLIVAFPEMYTYGRLWDQILYCFKARVPTFFFFNYNFNVNFKILKQLLHQLPMFICYPTIYDMTMLALVS
jgi:hypothetical protein